MKWTRSRIGSPLFWLWLLAIPLILWPSIVAAHGSGTPQLVNVIAGPYHLSVWTQPEPLRVGEAHFSIAVEQPAMAAEPFDDELTVQLLLSAPEPEPEPEPSSRTSSRSIPYPTTPQTRLFQRYYEADLLLLAEGAWRATLLIDGAAGHGEAEFPFTVSPAQRISWTVISWSTLAVVAVLGIIWAQRGAKP